jgi:hypothetical protein
MTLKPSDSRAPDLWTGVIKPGVNVTITTFGDFRHFSKINSWKRGKKKRLLNLQLQRQRCSRLERFYAREKEFLFLKRAMILVAL